VQKCFFSALKSSCLREVQECLEIRGLEMCRPRKCTIMLHFWRMHILCFRGFWSSYDFTDLLQCGFLIVHSFFWYQKLPLDLIVPKTWLIFNNYFNSEFLRGDVQKEKLITTTSKALWKMWKEVDISFLQSVLTRKNRVDSIS
jgi:hypothetical protein